MKVLEKPPSFTPFRRREGQPGEAEQETLARRLKNIKDLKKKVGKQQINVVTPDYPEKPPEIPAKTDEYLTGLDPQTRTIVEGLIKRRRDLEHYIRSREGHRDDTKRMAEIDARLAKWGIVLPPKKAA